MALQPGKNLKFKKWVCSAASVILPLQHTSAAAALPPTPLKRKKISKVHPEIPVYERTMANLENPCRAQNPVTCARNGLKMVP